MKLLGRHVLYLYFVFNWRSKLLERWAARPKNVSFTSVNRRQSHSRKNNAFSLVGVTSNSQPGFFVAEHQSITDLVSSQPGFAKKGVSFRSSCALNCKRENIWLCSHPLCLCKLLLFLLKSALFVV